MFTDGHLLVLDHLRSLPAAVIRQEDRPTIRVQPRERKIGVFVEVYLDDLAAMRLSRDDARALAVSLRKNPELRCGVGKIVSFTPESAAHIADALVDISDRCEKIASITHWPHMEFPSLAARRKFLRDL